MQEPLIVITGGAGFIGSCLVRHLNDLHHDRLVIVDDLRSNEKWKNLVGKRFSDVIHKHHLFDWLLGKEREIGAIFHLGACSNTMESDCNYLLENNYRYSVKLAEFALTHGIRFIYASSAATYGDGSCGFSDDHEGLEKLTPLNMYGFSKHLFDLWLKNQKALDKVVGLKYFNVFGPNEYHKGRMASPILKMVPEALSSHRVQLFKSDDPTRFADGEQVRDFIYVKDVVAMTAIFLKNNLTGIFNVGRGVGETWKSLAEAVLEALNKKILIDYVPMPRELVGKYQNYTCATMKKWQEQGLPKTRYSLKEAIVDYVRNYLLAMRQW